GKRLLGFGLLAWWFCFPLFILLPFKIFAAWYANRRMNAYFQEHAIGWGIIRPGTEIAGFVFTTHDEGTKQVPVRLISTTGVKDFLFAIPIPGLNVDHGNKQFDEFIAGNDIVECSEGELRERLAKMPRSTTSRRGTKEGDPLNLVAIGDFDAM